MKDRTPVFNDIRVLAAIEALKAALLQVNGDVRVKSLIVQADLRPREDAPENRLVAYSDICPCADCTGNMKRQYLEILRAAAADAAGQGGVVH
jgi:hypothetical protein